ncbi:MAG: chemotaxis protein CheW [Pacificimonas sp.]|jgi:purine-binding chemotaxis protein CheW|nr:chemotaxis protein CheW [Pacificimonas sp.]
MSKEQQLVTLALDGRALCVDVATVQDVIKLDAVTPVPRAQDWIAGVMNLRGHIVTAIDMRRRLGLAAAEEGARQMCVVVQLRGDAFALIVDSVGEVIGASADEREPDPPTLPPAWRSISRGVVRRADELLLEIDPGALIDTATAKAA